MAHSSCNLPVPRAIIRPSLSLRKAGRHVRRHLVSVLSGALTCPVLLGAQHAEGQAGLHGGCKSALINGFISLGPVIAMGAVFAHGGYGLYDLSLSSVFADNDLFIFLAPALAVADYVIIIAIGFFARRKRDEKYTSSLGLKGPRMRS